MTPREICSGIACALLLSTILYAQAPAGSDSNNSKRILVHAFDSRGQFLRSGLGFIYDEHTVLTGYQTVKGASSIKVNLDDVTALATEITSSSTLFDLAVLKSKIEFPESTVLASSDTIAAGDPVFYFQREKGSWLLRQAQAKSWIDSGKGYQMIRLTLSSPSPAEPSPLLNASGSVVGWFPGGSEAVPLKAVYSMFLEKSFSVSLPDMITQEKFWKIQEVSAREPKGETLRVHELKRVTGPKSHPFGLDLPSTWPHQFAVRTQRLLLLAMNGECGISLALRIAPAESEDLNQEMERTETLMFSGSSRSELMPHQAGDLSGLKAIYEGTGPQSHSSTVFYALEAKRFYVLSATYPDSYKDEVQNLISQVFSSFTIASE